MINLNDYLDCPEKIQHIDGRKVVSLYKFKAQSERAFCVEFANGWIIWCNANIDSLKPIQQERWQEIDISTDGFITDAGANIYPSAHRCLEISNFNAAFNIDTLQIVKKETK